MILNKIFFHANAIIRFWVLKFLYGEKISIGKRTTCRRRFNVTITSKAKIKIGDDCFFNNDCSLNAMSEIEIGNGTIIGENVKIYDHNHRFNRKSVLLKKQGYSISPVKIGENCWIGSNVVILKGVKIGNRCVIGAGAIVDCDIESESMFVQERKNHVEDINFRNE